ERLCDRIGVVDEGRLRAEGTRRELTRSIGERDTVRIGLTGPIDAALEAVRALDGVDSASATEGGLDLIAEDGGAVVARALDAATSAGAAVTGVEITQPDLEAVFLHL